MESVHKKMIWTFVVILSGGVSSSYVFGLGLFLVMYQFIKEQ